MSRKATGWMIICMAIAFGTVQTRFFGNNTWPESPAEIIADGITILIACIGFATMAERERDR